MTTVLLFSPRLQRTVDKPLHPDLTLEVVEAAMLRRRMSLDNPGFCLACGVEADGVEPDAREYTCESCGEPEVYGADELFMAMVPL